MCHKRNSVGHMLSGEQLARCYQGNTVGQMPPGEDLHSVIVQHKETATYERRCHPSSLVSQPFTVTHLVWCLNPSLSFRRRQTCWPGAIRETQLARCHQGNTVSQVSSGKDVGQVPSRDPSWPGVIMETRCCS